METVTSADQIAWFDAHPQPKALNRQPGYWLCILGCGPETCRGMGETPEDAIQSAREQQQKPRSERTRVI